MSGARVGPHTSIPGLPALMPRGAGSRSGWTYSDGLGERIAAEYVEAVADNGGLWAIAAAYDWCPPPRVIQAWRAQFPQFGLRMREAEKLRAERLVEQAIVLADTADASPARVALMIGARQYLAERLDRARFGRSGDAGASERAALGQAGAQLVAHDVSDEALAKIACGEAVAAGTGGGADAG